MFKWCLWFVQPWFRMEMEMVADAYRDVNIEDATLHGAGMLHNKVYGEKVWYWFRKVPKLSVQSERSGFHFSYFRFGIFISAVQKTTVLWVVIMMLSLQRVSYTAESRIHTILHYLNHRRIVNSSSNVFHCPVLAYIILVFEKALCNSISRCRCIFVRCVLGDLLLLKISIR